MQTLVEDFLQYLRHERGQSVENKRRDAEDAVNRRDKKRPCHHGNNSAFLGALIFRPARQIFIRNPHRAE